MARRVSVNAALVCYSMEFNGITATAHSKGTQLCLGIACKSTRQDTVLCFHSLSKLGQRTSMALLMGHILSALSPFNALFRHFTNWMAQQPLRYDIA
eukprot:TRINITY_DN8097_c0_g2_i1.p1 TRINITY_DN8097_c0_g2~~TRINITY_DN8097_c0_g2_i1.p1  ORF type:complete len:105 (+),score=11.25 TRINITY_DN8097_c0_g2_i1:27-317(+)